MRPLYLMREGVFIKNRVQNFLTVSNIMLSSVVSDTFGKSSSAILAHLLKHPEDQGFDFLPLLHGSMRKKKDEIALTIGGLRADDRISEAS